MSRRRIDGADKKPGIRRSENRVTIFYRIDLKFLSEADTIPTERRLSQFRDGDIRGNTQRSRIHA